MKIIKPSFEILSPIDSKFILGHLEEAGRICYKTEMGSTKDFVKKRIDTGHESVIEHISLTVKFICDRGVSHELVRHRLASFSQESTRYCNYSKDQFDNGIILIHPENLTEAQKIRREKHFWAVQDLYMLELSEGLSPQIARGVLPTALKTEIIMTANIREWRTIFKQRVSKAAHPQMRELTIPLLYSLRSMIPVLFDDIIPG